MTFFTVVTLLLDCFGQEIEADVFVPFEQSEDSAIDKLHTISNRIILFGRFFVFFY